MASINGRYRDFEIVWTNGEPSILKGQSTSDTKLHVTEGGVLTITDFAGGTILTAAPHTWQFLYQHPTEELRPKATFI